MRPVASLIFAVAIVVAACPGVAGAADAATRVALDPLADGDPFAERLSAELTAIGFGVIVNPSADGPLDAVARSAQASAAVRTLANRRGVEVWIDERASGRPMLRHLVVDERGESVDASLVVLQTVELLRANLLAPPAPRVDVSAQVASPPPAPTRFVEGGSARAGIGALVAPDGVGALPAMEVGAAARLRGPFALGLLGIVPVASASVGVSGAQASIAPFVVAAEASLTGSSGPWGGSVGLGGGAVLVRARGRADEPLVATTELATSGVALLRAAGGRTIAGPWRCGVTALAGLLTSPVTVKLASRDEARVGPLVVAAMASIEAAW